MLPRSGTLALHPRRVSFGRACREDSRLLPAWEGEQASLSGSGKTVSTGDGDKTKYGRRARSRDGELRVNLTRERGLLRRGPLQARPSPTQYSSESATVPASVRKGSAGGWGGDLLHQLFGRCPAHPETLSEHGSDGEGAAHSLLSAKSQARGAGRLLTGCCGGPPDSTRSAPGLRRDQAGFVPQPSLGSGS